MILVGSPGIGKSTLVKVLANEMKLQLLTWNDAPVDYRYEEAVRGEELLLPYQSALASFEEFLAGAGAGLDSLGVDVPSNQSDLEECHGCVILIEDVRFYGRDRFCFLNFDWAHCIFGCFSLCKIPNLHNAEAALSFR